MTAPLKLMLVAAEPSGDRLGAALMAALEKQAPGRIVFSGCGGPEMAAAGLNSLFPIDKLSVMGLKDVLPVIPEVLKRSGELARFAAVEGVDAAILIDSWGFNFQVAKRLRKAAPDVKVIKYVAPQVWASRPHRAATLKQHVDFVLTLLPFEPPYFEREGLPATFVGNPIFEAARTPSDGAAFRARHGLGDAPVLAVLPGSRKNEIRYLLEPFGETVARLVEDMPDLRILIPAAPNVADAVEAAAADWPGAPVIVRGAEEKAAAFGAADAALAASGTVTTELALAGTPMIVGYKVGWLTGLWARRVLISKYVSVVNVIAGWEVIPEYIQEICIPRNLAPAVKALLTDETVRARQLSGFDEAFAKLGFDGPPAGERAATAVLTHLKLAPSGRTPWP